jgi:hypothetical protein
MTENISSGLSILPVCTTAWGMSRCPSQRGLPIMMLFYRLSMAYVLPRSAETDFKNGRDALLNGLDGLRDHVLEVPNT